MPRRIAALCCAILVVALIAFPSRWVLADDERVDLLLVLAADVSRSVDERKFRLQREGYAAAMVDPRVVRAMTGGPAGRIALCFLEWSSDSEQIVVIDWTPIANDGDASTVANRIRDAPRAFMGRTSISAAIDFSLNALARSPFASARRTIDVSGDGTNNSGRPVTAARDAAVAQNVTINGLVILSEVPLPTNPMHTHPPGGLTAYYENNVIGGPGAFVVEGRKLRGFRPIAHFQAGEGDRSGSSAPARVKHRQRRRPQSAINAACPRQRWARRDCWRNCESLPGRISRWRSVQSRSCVHEMPPGALLSSSGT